MLKSLAAILLVASCTSSDGPENDVITPTPGGGSSPSGGDTSARIAGRVCVLADAQLTTACEITGGGGMSVSFGANTATTADDGSFSIDSTGVQPGTPISVAGATAMTPSQATVNANGMTIIPVMSNDMFNNMVLATGITTEPDTGVILASIESQQNASLEGITATSNPAATAGVFYDTATGTSQWGTNATGTRGIVLVPNVAATGSTSMTFTTASGGETTVDGIQVVNGGVTFADATLP